MSVSARLHEERGFALPVVLSIMATIALFAAAAVGFATHSTDRSNRDRAAVRALAAADAGIDAALYRMNKALFSSQVQGVLGVPAAALAEVDCVELDVSVGELALVEDLGNGWCPASAGEEEVDGASSAGEDWEPARFSYSVSTGIRITTNPSTPIIERRVVATGVSGEVTKRVMATARAELDATDNLVRVFEQVGYETCTPEVPNAADPASGC